MKFGSLRFFSFRQRVMEHDQSFTAGRLYFDRVAGGDRDHRCFDRAPAPSGAGCPRGGSKGAVHQQPETVGARSTQLHRVQRLPSDGPHWLPLALAARRPIINSYGAFIPLLLYLEQLALYNAMNFSVNMFDIPNSTIVSTGLSTLWCPSDAGVETPSLITFNIGPAPAAPVDYSSYAGNAGTWFNNWMAIYFSPATGNQQMNGVLYAFSSTRLSSVTDGTSNTIMFGEHTRVIENAADQADWHWWPSGYYGDTIFTAFWPINPTKKIPYTCQGVVTNPAVEAASSMHPGGANFGFMDGSVRFIKDSISCWVNNPANSTGSVPYTCVPNGLTVTTSAGGDPVIWNIAPGTQFGVYQQLSTRNGGEVISSDQY